MCAVKKGARSHLVGVCCNKGLVYDWAILMMPLEFILLTPMANVKSL